MPILSVTSGALLVIIGFAVIGAFMFCRSLERYIEGK